MAIRYSQPVDHRLCGAVSTAGLAAIAAIDHFNVGVNSMTQMMQDKVVVVTGSGGGIGRELALLMAAEGAKVVVNDIGTSVNGEGKDAGPAQQVVDEIRAKGGKAVANTDSVATWMGANAIIKTAIDNFGRIDCIVNNAGILRDRMFFKMNPEEWSAVIDVHLNGTFYVSRAAATYFKEQESGSYVHMTSTSGLIGNIGQANYGAAKLGITALSKMIAMDMARYHVRSNCIAPFAWSRMIGSIPADTPEAKARVEKLKTMEAAKIAPMAVYLGSDAAKDVTGQVFAVRANEIFLMSQPRPLRSVHRDGGWTAQSIAEHAIPAMRAGFYGLDRSQDVFSWDPV
jgi:NAD(P)-dependent dehydrogenase (short-subunit alcohol dehydrogenase family)